MPKFEWGVTLVMERQKCVPLIIEAETLEEAQRKASELFSGKYMDEVNTEQFKKMFPDVSLEHDEFDESFEDSWNECDVYGWDHVSPAKDESE